MHVCLHVVSKVRRLCIIAATHCTDERPSTGVDALVVLQRVGLRELATAHVAAVLPRPAVNQLVPTKVTRARIVFPALRARELDEQMFAPHVDTESLHTAELASTFLADARWRRFVGRRRGEFRQYVPGTQSVAVISQLKRIAHDVAQHVHAQKM